MLVFKSRSIMPVNCTHWNSLIHCSAKHRLCDIIVYGRCLVVSNCILFSQGCPAVKFLTWQQGWQRWVPLTLFSHHIFGPWCTPVCRYVYKERPVIKALWKVMYTAQCEIDSVWLIHSAYPQWCIAIYELSVFSKIKHEKQYPPKFVWMIPCRVTLGLR